MAVGELVDHGGQLGDFGPPGANHLVIGVRREQHARLVGKLMHRLRVAPKHPAQDACADEEQNSGRIDQRRPRLDKRSYPCLPLRRIDPHDGHLRERADHREHAEVEDRQPKPEAACCLHTPFGSAAPPKKPSIAAMSSCVENGFVMYRSAPSDSPLLTSASRPLAESITILM